MTMAGLRPYAYARLARRSLWRVAVPVSLIVAGLLSALAAGTYLSAKQTAYRGLENRLAQLARAARYLGQPGGDLVFDQQDQT